MAALSIQDRTRLWRGLMRYWSAQQETTAFLKSDLYNPVNNTGVIADLDNWIDTHSAITSADTVGANGALSVAMRSALTTPQKGLIVAATALLRTGNVNLLKSALSQEVD